MPMLLPQTYDREFIDLLERLRTEYPAELFRIEGIHEDQLDISKTASNFFRKGNADSTTADHSIDPNANVSGKDVITFNYEVPKPLMRLNSLYNLWKTIREGERGELLADAIIEAELSGYIYINDSWDIGRPYCFNYSCLDIALLGLQMGGRLTITPPKSLATFLRQVEQFTVYAANSTLGATGLADLCVVAARYVDMMFENRDMTNDWTMRQYFDGSHICVGVTQEQVWSYVKELFISLIYTLNWEFRGNQSPFTNISLYDRPFLEKMLPTYVIGGKTPKAETVFRVQAMFLTAFNEVLEKCPVTFPVITACFSTTTDVATGERTVADANFLRYISEANRKFGCVNIYMGETSTLSSCCRLRSSAEDLGYNNTLGSGSSKIGSLGVVTLNLPRIARMAVVDSCDDASRTDVLCEMLENVMGWACIAARVNDAKRHFIKDRVARKSLPLYDLGFMDLNRQYSTCGFTGLYEALEILGYDIRKPSGLDAAKNILKAINTANRLMAEKLGTPHNMEQTPSESSAVKLAQKDHVQGWNPEGYQLYSNQFVPLGERNVDLLDRIRLQGELDGYCTGGAVCHLNIGNRIQSPETMQALILHAAASGVVYFAINYCLNKCEEGHMSVGRAETHCPICGKEITDTFTRVVGFLTNTKHWNKTRRDVDWPNRRFYYHDEDKEKEVPEACFASPERK